MINLLSPIKKKYQRLDRSNDYKRQEVMTEFNDDTIALKSYLRQFNDIQDYQFTSTAFCSDTSSVSMESYDPLYTYALTGSMEGVISGIGKFIVWVYKKIMSIIDSILTWIKKLFGKIFGNSTLAKKRSENVYEEYLEIYKVLTPLDRDKAEEKFLNKPILYMPEYDKYKEICNAYKLSTQQLVSKVELLVNTEIADAPTGNLQENNYDYFNWMSNTLIDSLSVLGITITENHTTIGYKSPFSDLPKSTLEKLGYKSFDVLDEMKKLYDAEVYSQLKFVKELQSKLEHKKSTIRRSTFDDVSETDRSTKEQAGNMLKITSKNLETIVTLARNFASLNDTIQHRFYLCSVAAKRAVLTIKNQETSADGSDDSDMDDN